MPKDITRDKNRAKRPISQTRRQYILKLIGRIAVFFGCIYLCIQRPQSFEILNGYEFFHSFSVLHILWEIWMLGTILGEDKCFFEVFRMYG